MSDFNSKHIKPLTEMLCTYNKEIISFIEKEDEVNTSLVSTYLILLIKIAHLFDEKHNQDKKQLEQLFKNIKKVEKLFNLNSQDFSKTY